MECTSVAVKVNVARLPSTTAEAMAVSGGEASRGGLTGGAVGAGGVSAGGGTASGVSAGGVLAAGVSAGRGSVAMVPSRGVGGANRVVSVVTTSSGRLSAASREAKSDRSPLWPATTKAEGPSPRTSDVTSYSTHVPAVTASRSATTGPVRAGFVAQVMPVSVQPGSVG